MDHQPEEALNLDTVTGLSVMETADLPFGKQFQMGLVVYTIYDRAIEQGYQAGVAAHLDYLRELHLDTPVMPDEKQFVSLVNAYLPKTLDANNAQLWKGHFIAGWVSVYLGLSGMPEWYTRRGK